MAVRSYITTGVSLDPTTLMLARLFPRWRGDAAEPALPPPPSRPNRPTPAARQLVEA